MWHLDGSITPGNIITLVVLIVGMAGSYVSLRARVGNKPDRQEVLQDRQNCQDKMRQEFLKAVESIACNFGQTIRDLDVRNTDGHERIVNSIEAQTKSLTDLREKVATHNGYHQAERQ